MSHASIECPVCSIKFKDYCRSGDRLEIDCPRCGNYEISGTALAMLSSRLKENELAPARLSHAIRSRSLAKRRLPVSSVNLDEFVGQRLPGIKEQLNSLLVWLAAELGDDEWGRIPMPWPETLAGLIGAIDGDRVQRLIEHAANEGFVENDTDGDLLGLSPKGWATLEWRSASEESKKEESDLEIKDQIVRSHCSKCDGEKNAFRRSTHATSGHIEGVGWSDTWDILECCGCNSLSVKRTEWLSEWDYIDVHPVTGNECWNEGVKVTHWPSPTKRKKPIWADSLDDEVLRNVLYEVYQALNHEMIVLASVGARTVLDRAMFLRVDDPKGGFAGKLKLMVENGRIGKNEKETLEVITDAGSASAHRGFAPPAPVLMTIIEAIENFLHREFVLQAAATEVKAATPQRRPDASNGGQGKEQES